MTVSRTLLQASANALPLRDESVQCVVTSPPYWGLRQYAGEQTVAWPDGSTHPLGLEPTPELYVQHMVEVFREVRRVLRADGALWLNLGDSYAAQGGSRDYGSSDGSTGRGPAVGGVRTPAAGLKPKDLVGIPWMVAFALRADGWYLRSDIIWHKPNPMPESVTDRPTKAHEYLFLLTKSERYFYDAEAIRESSVSAGESRGGGKKVSAVAYAGGELPPQHLSEYGETPTHRNKRTVWTIATRPYPGAHFATYPEDLVEPCILAGTSPKACGVCSAPWERVSSRDGIGPTFDPLAIADSGALPEGPGTHRNMGGRYQKWLDEHPKQTTGWAPTCAHDDDTGVCTVLDPFNGSGTTGRVAIRHGRSYVGVDISREYLAEQATKRIDRVQHVMAGL